VNARPKLFQTHRTLYRGTVALILSLVVNVAFFAIAPLLLDRQIISVFSRHALLNLMMPLQPKPPEPELEKPELLEELPQLELTPLETEMDEEPPAPPEMTPPELETPQTEVPPLSPSTPSLDQTIPEMPNLKIDMKSLSAASVPIAVNVHPTLGKTPQMQQPTPSITENRPYGIGEVDSKPGILGQALPPYPRRARRRGVEGWVKVRFLITAKGRVRDLSVLQESPKGVFSKTVLNTVPRWRFKPAKKDGRPVEVWVEQTINFKLDR
jgi:periplasmic protein TonB